MSSVKSKSEIGDWMHEFRCSREPRGYFHNNQQQTIANIAFQFISQFSLDWSIFSFIIILFPLVTLASCKVVLWAVFSNLLLLEFL